MGDAWRHQGRRYGACPPLQPAAWGVRTKAAARGQERQTKGTSEGGWAPEDPADGSRHGD